MNDEYWSYSAAMDQQEVFELSNTVAELEERIIALEAENAELKADRRHLAPIYKGMDENYAELWAVKAENAALREAQRWVPVSERLPEENTEVLYGFHPNHGKRLQQ